MTHNLQVTINLRKVDKETYTKSEDTYYVDKSLDKKTMNQFT